MLLLWSPHSICLHCVIWLFVWLIAAVHPHCLLAREVHREPEREETLLLIGEARVPVFRLSYQDMHDWLKQWPALALACGLPLGKDGNPRIPSPSQQCKRRRAAGAPLHESLFVLTVLHAMRRRLIGAHDLIIDSAPILAWRRRDPDAADLACSQRVHPRPLLLGYRVHTFLCRGCRLPIFFLLSPGPCP
jgi:hypothetical protein